MKKSRMERGQVLVLIILAIVAMFGFAALAVDLGRLYAERRRIQNAADASALAAAYAASELTDPVAARDAAIAAAIDQFELNDVSDTDPNENPDIEIDVEVYNPPLSGPYGPDSGLPLAERSQYFQIMVHSGVDAVFSQFVYGGPLDVTVESVSRYAKASGLFSGDVLHANSPSSCRALWFTGTGDVHLIGGNAFSDSTAGVDEVLGCQPIAADDPGGDKCVSGVQGGTGTILLEGGTISTSGPWIEHGSGEVTTDGPVNQCVQAKPLPHVPEPDCSGLPYRTYDGGSATLQPGVYQNGIVVHGKNTEVHLEPGMYCLNGDLLMNGGIITGDGVFFYMHDGAVQLGGNTSVNLSAAHKYTVYPEYPGVQLPDMETRMTKWNGMLIYMPAENEAEVHIGGGSGSQYTGTILAPGPRSTEGQDKCVIEGSGTSIGLSSNVICYTIKIAGTANVVIDYQEDANFRMPPTIDLAQ